MKQHITTAKQLMAVVAGLLLGGAAQAEDWTSQAIAPVVNPIFFESPLIQSEARPIFMWHRADKSFLGTDVDVRVYALQLRYAVNDRLAIIATKDGYIEFNPKVGAAASGWGNISAGLKYAVYKNDEAQAIVTPGLTLELPTGNQSVFQGNGSGDVNVFVSAAKGWDRFHLTGNLGVRTPFDTDKGTAALHSSLMVDYFACKWFIPFAAVNTYTTISKGNTIGLTSEGFDLINFGSSRASGRTQTSVGFGFRSRLTEKVDLGLAYERGVAPGNDIFKDRFTVDFALRF